MRIAEFLHQRRPLTATFAAPRSDIPARVAHENGGASPPLFEVDSSESVSNPFVQVFEDVTGFRESEVLLPA